MKRGGAAAAAILALLAASTGSGAGLPGDSLYQLHAELTTQQAATVGFDVYRGHPTLISMFYGSCPAACPMLIDAMQVYESQLDHAERARLRVLLVSFDAARDTSRALARISRLHHADTTRWTFASASESDTRRIAALLGISYRRMPDGDYDHSLLVTLLDSEGRVLGSTTKLVGDAEFAAKLRAATQIVSRAY